MPKTKKRTARRTLDIIRAYKNVFGSAEGQTVLYDLMKSGYILKPTYDRSDTAALRNEGKRELCLYILERINMDIDKLMEVIQEETAIEEEYFH